MKKRFLSVFFFRFFYCFFLYSDNTSQHFFLWKKGFIFVFFFFYEKTVYICFFFCFVFFVFNIRTTLAPYLQFVGCPAVGVLRAGLQFECEAVDGGADERHAHRQAVRLELDAVRLATGLRTNNIHNFNNHDDKKNPFIQQK